MLIDLTDHLRCPADHREEYLVVLPEEMRGRHVMTGDVGCPLCGRTMVVKGGILRLGNPPPVEGQSALTAESIAALLMLDGPGGYVALVGNAGCLARDVALELPGVHFVAINAPSHLTEGGASDGWSVLYAERFPLKEACLRGVVIGSDVARDEDWIRGAARALLPGLRAVIEGEVPDGIGLVTLAKSPGCWVGQRGTATGQ